MGKLIYFITTTLDGFVADENGNFDFTSPNEDDLALVNGLLRNVGTFIFGKRMYDTMAIWDTLPFDDASPGMTEFAEIWKYANKIVYSSSLADVSTVETKIERVFDAESLRKSIANAEQDFSIGGPHLAGEAMRAGLIDEIHQVIAPVIIGGGNYWLPKDFKSELTLVDSQTFESGRVHLHYRPIRS